MADQAAAYVKSCPPDPFGTHIPFLKTSIRRPVLGKNSIFPEKSQNRPGTQVAHGKELSRTAPSSCPYQSVALVRFSQEVKGQKGEQAHGRSRTGRIFWPA